ncbi:MAG: MBOAT family O-acyltransferase [Clostridiaceae bacterium]|nr:MBOAT family O-acyltransferase [Clostridiaceae bacterium]
MILASLFFYGFGSIRFLPLLVGTMLFNYGIVTGLSKVKARGATAKVLLTAAFSENIGLLLYYKYTNFLIGTVNAVAGTDFALRNIILPLGISFFTFQILSYVVDVYRGQSRRSSFYNYAVFVTFFPQLIVGPIIRHDDMAPQIADERFGKPDARNMMLGTLIFAIGCAKKIVVADPLITHAQNFYNVMGNGNFFEAWGAVFSYTFAYYFDFSGYTDMAIALGLFFNVKLPQGFDSPYKARNFADFWRRWNITVSRFFEDYIFRNIFHFGNRIGKLIFATMVTFLVSGLWHGAGWHYVLWGAVNGVLVCAANIMAVKRKRFPSWLAYTLTFIGVLLVRVLFDANSVSQAMSVYRTLVDIRPAFTATRAFFQSGLAYLIENPTIILLILGGMGICFFAPNTREIAEKYEPKGKYAAYAGVLLAVSLLFMGRVSSFLYFQF